MPRDQFGLPGIEAAVTQAAALDPTWPERAFVALREYARTAAKARRLFTIEMARAKCPAPPEGADLRAWGAITTRALREGVIERTGQFAAARSSNGSPKALYRGPRPKRSRANQGRCDA